MKETFPELPDDIKNLFHPVETINTAGNKYWADPLFVPFQNDSLKGSDVNEYRAADNSLWIVAEYSPRQETGKERGVFCIMYCRKTLV